MLTSLNIRHEIKHKKHIVKNIHIHLYLRRFIFQRFKKHINTFIICYPIIFLMHNKYIKLLMIVQVNNQTYKVLRGDTRKYVSP